MTETSDRPSPRTRALERLCLALALLGALLCVGGLYGNMRARQVSPSDMPIFEKSRPAVTDWPRRAPDPRS